MKLIRHERGYTVRDVPVYGSLEFTRGSTEWLNSPQAFEFAKQHGGRLQSLGEAVVARVAFYNDDKESYRGFDASNDHQKISTVSLNFRDDKKIVTAFAELDDTPECLALVQEGYDANSSGRNLLKPLDQSIVSRLVQMAKERGRICFTSTARALELSTVQKNGKSDYGCNEVVVAAFGSSELAELNAGYLQERRHEKGFLWHFTTEELEKKLQGNEGHALIRHVALGGYNCVDGSVICANFSFTGGRARGVIHGEQKISPVVNVLQEKEEGGDDLK